MPLEIKTFETELVWAPGPFSIPLLGMAQITLPLSGSLAARASHLAPPATAAPPRAVRTGLHDAGHAGRLAPAVVAGIAVRSRGRGAKAMPSPLQEAKDMSQPNRTEALEKEAMERKARERQVLGADKTVEDVLPAAMLESDLGKELKVGIETMVEVLHQLSLGMLVLEESKDRGTIGLNGIILEKKYCRLASDGTQSTMPALAVTSYVMKQLLENFPDDPVLSDEDGEILSRDEEFAQLVAGFMSSFKFVPDATAEKVAEWSKHCNSYSEGEPPKRYWVFMPVDSKSEFRDAKQFCTTLCLMQDNEPVLSVMGCPVLNYDHPSRSTPHPSASPIYYAMKGQGAWTQCVVMKREMGLYQGQYGLKGKSLKLNVSEKIRRKNDGLYDALGTEQLRISQHARMRQDIFLDSERIAKLLGSEYAKFNFVNSSVKFSRLPASIRQFPECV